MKYFAVFLLLLSLAPSVRAQNGQVEELRRAAMQEVGYASRSELKPEDTVYKSGGLALQALNPEISITGDMLGSYEKTPTSEKISNFNFRNLGLHFQSYLDPYSRFKSAVEVHPGEGAELGEAYFTRFGVFNNVNITAGKFRQQFGLVNRWHKHGIDQVDFPLALRQIFGEGGLNQTGISVYWLMPELLGSSEELTFEMTSGENGRVFSGNEKSRPCFLVRYKNYRDINENTYFEFGLTGLAGSNEKWTMNTTPVTYVYHARPALAGAVDFTFFWEPTYRMRYENFLWRTEFYFLNKKIMAPDGSGEDLLKPWGAYTYVQKKISRTLSVGMRADYYKPSVKNYANLSSALSLFPLAVTKTRSRQWQLGPYVVWNQSPFVRFRVEYNHLDSRHMGGTENIFYLQCIFAAGPHKHEKY